MDVREFIDIIAPVAVRDWQQRRIMIPSVVIAQAIKESNKGNSELAVKANALFGIKKNGWTGKTYVKDAVEQNIDGTYRTDKAVEWRAYNSWEESVIDHNTYIATRKIGNQTEPNWSKVIGESNYLLAIQHLQNAEYPYATSQTYVESIITDYILKYNLTQYDEVDNMSKKTIVIDAGHGLHTQGKRCLKSIDKNETREWWLNDRIADRLQKLLANYNCTVIRVDDTTGAKDISLADRVDKANIANANVYISIHHNAGVNGGTGGGTQVYYYSSNSERQKQAQKLYDAIVGKTKLVGNRSSKVIKNGFYVIKNTKMPAFLIENGFMDSKTDVPIILSEKHAESTAQGILDFLVGEFSLSEKNVSESTTVTQKGTLYRVQVGAYANKDNAIAMQSKLKKAGFEAIIVE